MRVTSDYLSFCLRNKSAWGQWGQRVFPSSRMNRWLFLLVLALSAIFKKGQFCLKVPGPEGTQNTKLPSFQKILSSFFDQLEQTLENQLSRASPSGCCLQLCYSPESPSPKSRNLQANFSPSWRTTIFNLGWMRSMVFDMISSDLGFVWRVRRWVPMVEVYGSVMVGKRWRTAILYLLGCEQLMRSAATAAWLPMAMMSQQSRSLITDCDCIFYNNFQR